MKLPIYIIVMSDSETENELVCGDNGRETFVTSSYHEAIQFKNKLLEYYSDKNPIITYKILRCTVILGV